MKSRRVLFSAALLAFAPFLLAQKPLVYVIRVDGPINPANADFIHTSLQQSAEDGTQCLVVELNTPGGLLKSTRVIVTDLLNAPVPVVLYVSPSGS